MSPQLKKLILLVISPVMYLLTNRVHGHSIDDFKDFLKDFEKLEEDDIANVFKTEDKDTP